MATASPANEEDGFGAATVARGLAHGSWGAAHDVAAPNAPTLGRSQGRPAFVDHEGAVEHGLEPLAALWVSGAREDHGNPALWNDADAPGVRSNPNSWTDVGVCERHVATRLLVGQRRGPRSPVEQGASPRFNPPAIETVEVAGSLPQPTGAARPSGGGRREPPSTLHRSPRLGSSA